MKLLPRVMTLIRANLNDLLDRAEDPEKMIKQLIADLNNHLIQVKTAAAQSLADQHLLERRLQQTRKEMEAAERQAELAVRNQDDGLARAALERYNSLQRTAEETETQLDIQRRESEALKVAFGQIEMKVAEITRQRDVYLARQRRATTKEQLCQQRPQLDTGRLEEVLNAIEGYVDQSEAKASAAEQLQALGQQTDQYRLNKLESDDQVGQQLARLKARIGASPAGTEK